MGRVASESSRRYAPNRCLIFLCQGHVPGQGQAKGQNESFSHFWLSSRQDGMQGAQTHPTWW